ncbi:MAG: hypothetical protein R3186_05125 [Ruegeria sp.]|nr:hypothetical protein [Ruegeria sp.]
MDRPVSNAKDGLPTATKEMWRAHAFGRCAISLMESHAMTS